MVYPDELDFLLNKKMAFKVKVQPNFSQASVHKLDTDESFYTQIVNDYINCEVYRVIFYFNFHEVIIIINFNNHL